jgi:F-type H+-transporting ATPase subunit epsilon
VEVHLVSPEKILYSGEATFVLARTLGGGDIAFLDGHAPFIGALAIHPVLIRPAGGGADVVVAVHGGFVEVSGSRVTILSDVAELQEQVDPERARRALAAAGDDAAARARAETRLAVAEGRAHAGAH